MNILDNIEIIDLGLYLKNHQTLIISDTQIGYEESLNKQGFLLPRFQFNDLINRFSKIINKCNPKKIIIDGDIKHEFGTISKTEWRYTIKLIDFLAKKAELILVKGNHDTILGPIASKKNIEIVDYYCVDDIYLCHGHNIPDDEFFKKSKTIIIGHAHPAIGLKDSGRIEKYKCFLKGNFNDKTLIVMPSFNLLTEGSDVLCEKLLSPFLEQVLKKFEVFVVGEVVRYFGHLKDITN